MTQTLKWYQTATGYMSPTYAGVVPPPHPCHVCWGIGIGGVAILVAYNYCSVQVF